MRLQKYLAHAGVASRRAAEEIVRAGRVTVDGAVVTDPARDVDPEAVPPADVRVDGRPVAPVRQTVVFAVHKPAGVVSTASDTHGRPTVVGLVPAGERRLYPVGRLDAETTGLILLTDDGALADLLTHPRYEVPKTYVAQVRGGRVGEAALRRLREGVELDDGPTLPAEVEQPAPGELRLTLREGRKRQVRRMCRAVGHPVTALTRVRLGPLELGRLREGEWRALEAREVAALRDAARHP
ncbi:pseudouridine synthase [Patulibacter defluvii]|uniref:pseudouridine synthase n=1 Tax=Patulibacter defluvii TaxID=3095358 RepID=UPI002A76353D|nr:pseudouridine synthase [Patulibacter sp. DM4]